MRGGDGEAAIEQRRCVKIGRVHLCEGLGLGMRTREMKGDKWRWRFDQAWASSRVGFDWTSSMKC